jgi:hypothetical protein
MEHILLFILTFAFLGLCDEIDHIPVPGCTRGTAKDVIKAWISGDDAIDTIPAAVDHVISDDITFLAENHWYTVGLDKVGSSFNFQSQGEGQSKEYANTVILFVAGVGPVVSKIVTGFIRGRYNLLIQDANGNKHLLGAYGDGAEVSVQVQNDRNGYILTFLHNSADLPFNYTGAITIA